MAIYLIRGLIFKLVFPYKSALNSKYFKSLVLSKIPLPEIIETLNIDKYVNDLIFLFLFSLE